MEFRIPISILNVRDEDNTQPSAALPELTAAQEISACADPGIAAVSNPKKSKLQILAETLEDERRSPSSGSYRLVVKWQHLRLNLYEQKE